MVKDERLTEIVKVLSVYGIGFIYHNKLHFGKK